MQQHSTWGQMNQTKQKRPNEDMSHQKNTKGTKGRINVLILTSISWSHSNKSSDCNFCKDLHIDSLSNINNNWERHTWSIKGSEDYKNPTWILKDDALTNSLWKKPNFMERIREEIIAG